jgi:mono/diheme cytochrome c family protein
LKPPKVLAIIVVLLIVLAGGMGGLVRGYHWWEGLASPPSIKPEMGGVVWSSPAGSVGSSSATFEQAAEAPLPRDQAATALTNPVASTPDSVEKGKKTFGIYCSQCHGAEGHGDGLVAKKMIFRPPDLPSAVKIRTDGYLYATIRNGGPLMPPQGYRIPPADRWDVVNFLRSIQKQ